MFGLFGSAPELNLNDVRNLREYCVLITQNEDPEFVEHVHMYLKALVTPERLIIADLNRFARIADKYGDPKLRDKLNKMVEIKLQRRNRS